jgi:hypothetical protein
MTNFVKALDWNGRILIPVWEVTKAYYGEEKGGCIHWPTRKSSLLRPSIKSRSQWRQEGSLECLWYIATGFLRNLKAVDVRNLVEDLITSYEKLGCNMSLMSHFLHSHLDSFRVMITWVLQVTDKVSICTRTSQRWRTHIWSDAMLNDFCCTVKRAALETQ